MNEFLISIGLKQPEISATFVPIGTRTIYVNDPIKQRQQEFLNNSVSTGKYNIFTFIPKFLFEFFSKYANLFFLFTGTVQLIGQLSPTSRYGTIIPLSIIALITASKEIVEDNKRHIQDRTVNTRVVKVLRGSFFEECLWKDIVVGDVVKVENSSYFPADIIILSSSEPDGLCFIETSNLDGETNLKIRQAIPETADLVSPETVSRLDAIVKSELPNNSLYTFDATLNIKDKKYPIGPNQLLLRGAQLKNTKWVYAIVVFTGHETKLMMNSTTTPLKRTKVENMVNSEIILLFFVLLGMALICAFGQLLADLTNPFDAEILMSTNGGFFSFITNVLTFIILFNNLIPLSLIVTVEIVKLTLGQFINSDLDLYYEVNDTPATAKTSSLVEELGQVDFIFSDKTGTLTRNIMEFKMASIGGIAYAEQVPDDKRIHVDENGREVGYHVFSRIQQHKDKGINTQVINDFLTLLAVCHTVIPEIDDADPTDVTFQASSPDEAALVDGAKSLGYLFHTRKPKSVIIAVNGEDQEFEVLNINEFNSTRKRMSIVVRAADGRIRLFIKGADTVIFERLSFDNMFLPVTQQHLEEYANEGLRTLVLAYRDIPESEYRDWLKVHQAAATTINNRQEALDNAAEMIETDLQLLGATAIEDKLQDDVPDTIHTLMEAGIRVWVLTGDRQETAINIGFSCKLITPDMLMMICNETTHFETKEFLQQRLAQLKASLDVGSSAFNKWKGFERGVYGDYKFDKDFGVDMEPMALIIDGKSLNFALEDDVKDTFLELALLCKAVICCRVSPLQKALVVKLVKQNVGGAITLAIGDGANDVSMIQAAHVGIGISGQEGLQAARSADFAIAQFKYLRKLLLVHGGWAYSRISKVITICFYKNITLYLIQFWFTLNNNFSGMTLFETWSSVSAYNVLWTLLPPFVLGVFDQYVTSRTLDSYPQMYRIGQNDTFYNHRVFIFWIINSFFHSLVIFYFWAFVIGSGDVLIGGRDVDNWVFGIFVYASTLVTVIIKHCLVADIFVGATIIAFAGSLAAYFVVFPMYAFIGPLAGFSKELYNTNFAFFTTPSFWFGILLVPILVNFRDFVWKFYKRSVTPQAYHIVQEIQKLNIADHRPRREWLRKAVHKVRMNQRMKQTRGYAFSQNEGGQEDLIRLYDTTLRKPRG
ncbi:hypothetical protein HDV04_004217 [Boothiomyces sp. JEL0838]|nr:hypothetical protein HDV04_004217 [Boothiomyces sp. JEL0838]